MTEERGAFKTIPANLRQIWSFVIACERRCKAVASKSHSQRKKLSGGGAAFTPPIFNKRHRIRCDILGST
jgi:hypothetical protein